jgi:tetratricopeptide (TPR) repeat protein
MKKFILKKLITWAYQLGMYFYEKAFYLKSDRIKIIYYSLSIKIFTKFHFLLNQEVLSDELYLSYNNKGLTLHKIQKYEAAVVSYDKALEFFNKLTDEDKMNRSGTNFYFNRGNSYHSLKQYGQAKNNYEKATTYYPNEVEAYVNYAMVVMQEKEDNYEVALNYLHKAQTINPYYFLIQLMLADIKVAQKQYVEAIQEYSKAIDLNPKHSTSFLGRGNAYQENKQYQEAIRDYSTAMSLGLQSLEVYFNRGLAYFHLQNYTAALRDFNKTIDLQPDHKLAYYNRGLTKLHLDKHKDGLDDLRKSGMDVDAMIEEFKTLHKRS